MIQSRVPPMLIGGLLLSIFAANAAAAESTLLPAVQVTGAAPSSNGQLPLDESSETASRLGLTLKETPASVSIVDRAALEARGVRNTQEALYGVPGLTAAAPPGSPGSVSYRGFSGSQITQLFNGITVQYDAIAARPVDSWIYDRVEAIGGASSFLYGAGAVGGSINYLTKLPERGEDFLDAFGSYGSNGAGVGAVGLNRRLGGEGGVGHVLRADLSHADSDGYVDGARRRSTNAAVSLLSDIAPGLSHTLAVEYQREVNDRPYWGTPVLNPAQGTVRILDGTRFKNYNSSDGRYDQTVKWARSILSYRASDTWSIKNTLYHYDALRNYQDVENYRFNASNTAVIRSSALLQRHDQDVTGDRLEFTRHGMLGAMRSDWAFGADYSVNEQTRFPRSVSGAVSTVDPFDFDTESFFSIPGMTPGFMPDRSNRLKTLAIFAENRTQLAPRWSVLTGLRYDRIDLSVTNHRTVSATDPERFERSYRPLTGRAAVMFDITPDANIYAQYSTAADPPAGVLTTANFSALQDFDLTTGRQIEIGSKIDFWEGRANATLAAYRIVRKNLAMADPADPGTTLPVGQQSSRGLEAAIGARLTRKLSVQANYALVSAQFDDFTENAGGAAVSRAGNRPANIPRQVANIWVDYALSGNWSAGLDARFVDGVFGNAANTVRAPGYAIFGARLAYRVNRKLTVTARVRNLADKVYVANLTSTPMAYLGEPRVFDIALSARF